MAKTAKNIRQAFWAAPLPWEGFVLILTGVAFWFVVSVWLCCKLVSGCFSIYETYQDAKDHFASAPGSVVIYRNVDSNDDWIFSNATIEVKPREEND